MKFHPNKRSEEKETNELIQVLRARNDHFESILADLKRQHVEELAKMAGDQLARDADMYNLAEEVKRLRHDFKNFHRLLCDRFGYVHDDIDWHRDQLSLIEHIAASLERKP